jgi:hypothetical protein
MRNIKEIRSELKQVRQQMHHHGIKRTSCFNGGMTRDAQRFNEKMFALETELKDAKLQEQNRVTLDFVMFGTKPRA